MIRLCFHVHSEYSYDSLLSLKKISDEAEKNKINIVIITDHNNLISQTEVDKIPQKVKIIVSEEIMTSEGEIIGLFLKERVESGLSAEETIRKIKDQGGVVIIPHPFDRFRGGVIKKEALLKNIDKIEVIEIFNAGNIINLDNRRAQEFAQKHDKIAIVGSDAHLASEIKRTSIEMEEFNGPQDFLEKLKKAKFYTDKSSFFVHVLHLYNKIVGFFKK